MTRLSSPFSLCTSAESAPYGKATAHHRVALYPGTPASIIVGTSGNAGERSAMVTASGRTRPDLMCGIAGTMSANIELDLAGDEIGHRLHRAFVGHVHDVHAGHGLEHLAADVRLD